MQYDEDGGVEVANFELTGWKAIIGLVVILGVAGIYGWQSWTGRQAKPAPPEVNEPLKLWIAANYTHAAFADVETGGGLGMTDKEKARVGLAIRQMVKPEDITLKDVQIRGDHEDEAVVRATIEIKDRPLPDGKDVHYYEVRWQSLDRKWTVMHEVDEFHWNSAAW